MHFRVVMPPNAKAGQLLRIRAPDGTEGDVRVPKDVKAGETFIFEMEVSDPYLTWETAQRQQNLQSRLDGSTDEAIQQGGDWNGKETGILNFCFMSNKLYWEDLLAALGVGMIVGMSIVGGFLCGVIMVTEP